MAKSQDMDIYLLIFIHINFLINSREKPKDNVLHKLHKKIPIRWVQIRGTRKAYTHLPILEFTASNFISMTAAPPIFLRVSCQIFNKTLSTSLCQRFFLQSSNNIASCSLIFRRLQFFDHHFLIY